jgi:hypothetical protein
MLTIRVKNDHCNLAARYVEPAETFHDRMSFPTVRRVNDVGADSGCDALEADCLRPVHAIVNEKDFLDVSCDSSEETLPGRRAVARDEGHHPPTLVPYVHQRRVGDAGTVKA